MVDWINALNEDLAAAGLMIVRKKDRLKTISDQTNQGLIEIANCERAVQEAKQFAYESCAKIADSYPDGWGHSIAREIRQAAKDLK